MLRVSVQPDGLKLRLLLLPKLNNPLYISQRQLKAAHASRKKAAIFPTPPDEGELECI